MAILAMEGDKAEQEYTCSNLGYAYQCLGNFKQAVEYYKQELAIAEEAGNRTGQGRAYNDIGNAYGSLGDFKHAREYHSLHLSIAQEAGDKAVQGCAYGKNVPMAILALRIVVLAISNKQEIASSFPSALPKRWGTGLNKDVSMVILGMPIMDSVISNKP